jgi:futalosine hydrolase
MSFKILYVTASSLEAAALKNVSGMIPSTGGYRFGRLKISLLVTGVGSIRTAWAMKQWISLNEKPDLILNAGIAGSYKDEFPIGEVVMPVTDCFADAGIEDGSNFQTLPEAGLTNGHEFPFSDGIISADDTYCVRLMSILRTARAITVNTATGSQFTRDKLINKFNPDIETMEGATFFYICAMDRIPYLGIRAISNMVEPRDKSRWNIPFAISSLSGKLNEVLKTL